MAGLKDYSPLNLMASDADDLGAISACLQDAVAKLGDFTYLPEQRRFAFVANRFIWEVARDRRVGTFARVRVGVHFDDVTGVQHHKLRMDAKNSVVELLAMQFEPANDGAGIIILELAGGGSIRLMTESVNAYLSDISEPWRTRMKPSHET